MSYELLIRQSYHGTGGPEGYKFKVYNNKGKKLGELKDLPVASNVGSTLSINGEYYEITKVYDSPKPREKKTEVIYFELTKYTFTPDFDLGEIKKQTKDD